MIRLGLLLLLGASAPVAAAAPEKGQAVVADAASEGPRDLEALKKAMAAFVSGQPYGKTWKAIVARSPKPKDRRALAEAKTHPSLKNDPIEMQEQVRYERETDVEARYGFVLVRGVQVFRYGALASVELVFERIGRDAAHTAAFEADLRALSAAFADPAKALGVEKRFAVVHEPNPKGGPSSAPPGMGRIEFLPRGRR